MVLEQQGDVRNTPSTGWAQENRPLSINLVAATVVVTANELDPGDASALSQAEASESDPDLLLRRLCCDIAAPYRSSVLFIPPTA